MRSSSKPYKPECLASRQRKQRRQLVRWVCAWVVSVCGLGWRPPFPLGRHTGAAAAAARVCFVGVGVVSAACRVPAAAMQRPRQQQCSGRWGRALSSGSRCCCCAFVCLCNSARSVDCGWALCRPPVTSLHRPGWRAVDSWMCQTVALARFIPAAERREKLYSPSINQFAGPSWLNLRK